MENQKPQKIKSRSAVAVEVGGTHLTFAAVNLDLNKVEITYEHEGLDSRAPLPVLLEAWVYGFKKILAIWPTNLGEACEILGIGVAMPGPLDYCRGISKMEASVVQKFDALFAVNLTMMLADRMPKDFRGKELRWFNDAGCFTLGAARMVCPSATRVIGCTLGTGFGSAFYADGHCLDGGPNNEGGVPNIGWVGGQVWKNGEIGDNFFTTRGVLRDYETHSGVQLDPSGGCQAVFDLAKEGDPAAMKTIHRFGEDLGEFLAPWVLGFKTEVVVFGGSIAQSWSDFGPLVEARLKKDSDIQIHTAHNTAPLMGAAALFMFPQEGCRLPPALRPENVCAYIAKHEPKQVDYHNLALAMLRVVGASGVQRLKIDGPVGVLWDELVSKVGAALRAITVHPVSGERVQIEILWWVANCGMIDSHLIAAEAVKCSTGTEVPQLADLFADSRTKLFVSGEQGMVPSRKVLLHICVGPGASLIPVFRSAPLVLAKLPASVARKRIGANVGYLLGCEEAAEQNVERYDRFDGPIMEAYLSTLPAAAVVFEASSPH